MQNQETLLRLPDVEKIVGLKKSKLYNLINDGSFPKPIHLGKRSVRWKASTVYAWVNGLTAQEEVAA